MADFIITAQSQPVYDAWGIGDYWGCNEWIKWYSELRKVYNADESDYIWSKAWLDGVSGISGGNGTASGSNYIVDSVPLDCRTFDENFKKFLSANPNLHSAVYSGIGGLIAKPLGLGTDVVNGVIKFGQNTISTATSVSDILKYAIPVLIVILFIFLIIFIYKYSDKKVKTT